MLIKNRLRLILMFLVLLLCACSTSSEAFTGEWQLVNLNGSDPVPGTSITLVFQDDEVSGSAGCNSYSGRFSVTGSQITFNDLGMTLMACLDEQMNQQEGDYFIALNQVDTYKVNQDNLKLTGSNISLEFVKTSP